MDGGETDPASTRLLTILPPLAAPAFAGFKSFTFTGLVFFFIEPSMPILGAILTPQVRAAKRTWRAAIASQDEPEYERDLSLYTVPGLMAERGREAWTRPMFVAGSRPVAIGEIVLAAHCRGELLPAWNRVLQLVEGERRAADADDDTEADDSALQSLSEQFRYDRDLITAEETERWLAERGLTLHDFQAYCVRHYWADRAGDAGEPTFIDYESATDELWELLRAELLLDGELDRMALALSWRFAAAQAERADHGSERSGGSARATAADPSVEPWIERLGCDSRTLEEILGLEAVYQATRDRLMTPDRIQRSLGSLRLPLSRVDLETIDVDSLDAAHEVVLCVRVDGRALAEVASDGGLPYERSAVLFEDLVPELQQRVVSAASGDVLTPLPHVDGFHVHRLLARNEPDAADEQVRARVEREVLSHYFSELSATYIRWILAPSLMS